MFAEFEQYAQKGLEMGFTHVAPLKADTIICRYEVRGDCAVNKCHAYNKSWACPPACGTIEECQQRIREYENGLILQTTGELEDNFDYESMMATSANHAKHFEAFSDYIKEICPSALLIGTGGCLRCKQCTYPDAPCRFPNKLTHSMEAYGMVVSEVCQANNIQYYYGKNTITYVACVLVN